MTTVRISLILVSLSIITLAAHQTAPASQPALVTSSTEIDGVALRVRASLAKRTDAPVPVVVFESGAGMPLETWDPILEKVAAFAPVVAYDRSGTGQSRWDGQSPTPQRANQRLRKLLESTARALGNRYLKLAGLVNAIALVMVRTDAPVGLSSFAAPLWMR